MSIRVCADEHALAKPAAVVAEAIWVVAVEALVVVVLTLVFSYIAARENRSTTWPMPSGRVCASAGVHSCVFAERVSMKGCHER